LGISRKFLCRLKDVFGRVFVGCSSQASLFRTSKTLGVKLKTVFYIATWLDFKEKINQKRIYATERRKKKSLLKLRAPFVSFVVKGLFTFRQLSHKRKIYSPHPAQLIPTAKIAPDPLNSS